MARLSMFTEAAVDSPGRLDHERGIDQLNSHQADVLSAHERGQQVRRNVVGFVDEFAWFLCCRKLCAAPQSQPRPGFQRVCQDPGKASPFGNIGHPVYSLSQIATD